MTSRKPETKKPFTKAEFEALLRKASQPVTKPAKQPDPEGSGTSEHHPSDGYTATHTSPDTTEDAEGLPNG